jgi:RNA recognition motif-containing protein
MYMQPMDYVKGKHRGFAFVEYADADDATEAIFNMDGADLAGKTISASLAQPNQVHRLQESSSGTAGMVSSGSTTDQAVWTSDEWFQNQVNSGGAGGNNTAASTKTQRDREADATTLRGDNA